MNSKRLFGKICYLQRQMLRENNKLFSELGLKPIQLDTLVFIHRCSRKGVKVIQKDIEKELNLRPSSVSVLLANLEKRGYISRKIPISDARSKYIELTQKGINACLKNKILMEKCDGAVSDSLTLDEQNEFDRLLSKIIESVSTKKETE